MKILLAAALAVLLSACALLPERAGPITIEREHAEAMARMLSDYRRANGLGSVRVDPTLMAAAEQQARTVAARDRLDHGNFAARIHRHRVDTDRAFENLAAGDPTPQAALATWKASRDHQRALVSPESTRIGYVRALAPETRHRTFDVLVLASD
ncbi:CAP domain-containing protein [Salinarimonas rosea]|uniref:CAP domain-containing protein n=1 Tax=Salinarimonas rosea TaxID=552063 RepID=UPI0003FF7974|nr:CAP domain-containing protein [Salinarimonas rosea]